MAVATPSIEGLEDIPLVGRIVAVWPMFDALTSERPYKRPGKWTVPWPFEREQRQPFGPGVCAGGSSTTLMRL